MTSFKSRCAAAAAAFAIVVASAAPAFACDWHNNVTAKVTAPAPKPATQTAAQTGTTPVAAPMSTSPDMAAMAAIFVPPKTPAETEGATVE